MSVAFNAKRNSKKATEGARKLTLRGRHYHYKYKEQINKITGGTQKNGNKAWKEKEEKW